VSTVRQAPGPATPPAHASAGRPSTVRTFVWAFVSLFAVFTAWALANPLTAAPDEPAHATKAAAVVHGQLVGEMYDPEHPGWGHVTIPAVVAFTTQMPNCFAFKPEVTADCLPPLPADPEPLTQTISTASTYNPVYYWPVGLPSLVPTGAWTVYAMRLVSAALCAAALAWAFAQAGTVRDRGWVTTATLVALTPMVVYLGGAINPASLEIAAAVALWVSLSVLVRDDDTSRLTSRLAGVAVIGAVFVNLRGLSPLFLAIIALATVATVPWARTWRVLRARTAWPWVALVGIASVCALLWTRTAGTLDSDGVVHHPTLTFWTAVQWSLGDTSVYVTNMLGQFGWVDTNLPSWVLMLVALTGGSVVLLALAVGNRRERLVLLGLAVVTVVVPVVIHASQAPYLGIVWQGRYFLPAAVGLPVLSGFVLGSALGAPGSALVRRAVLLLGSSWLVCQVTAFLVNVHRYQKGTDEAWWGVVPDQWNPPLPVSLLLVVLVVGLLALVALCVRAARPGADRPPAPVDRGRAPAVASAS
jgi:hypothetical protein